MEGLESGDKQLMFDELEKGEPVEGHKERDGVVKVMSKENGLCSTF